MISLVWSMMVARRGQLLVVLLLSVFATGAAVAGPVYLAAVDRAAAATEVAEAPRTERVVSLSGSVERGDAPRFDNLTSSLLTLRGFTTVYSAQFYALGVEQDTTQASQLTFREGVCEHLVLLAGRCVQSANEVLLGESTARRRGLAPGTVLTITAAQYDENQRRYVPAGASAPLTVAGVYRPVDPQEQYWGSALFFTPGAPDYSREPVFVSRPAIDTIDHSEDQRGVDALPGPDALRVERLPALRAELAELAEALGGSGGGESFAVLGNGVTGLLDRIDRARKLARQVVPVAAVPLVALCWFVVFLAVADGTAARRQELGLLALRGVGRATRWWLGAGESSVAILVGAPIGFLAGVLGVSLLTRARFDDWAGAPVGPGAQWAALVALAGALLAGLLAQRRELARPVVELLRRVPARQARWRSVATEATVVVLAVVAAVQLRGFDGALVGLSLLAPALVALAVALVAVRLLLPLAGGFGGWALRRGRLGPALGALQLARRPGSQRLFVLLAVAVALLCYAAGAVDVAARARGERAEVQQGARRVLTVLPVDAGVLLHAVRTVDPTGRYAMAVGVLPATDPDEPSVVLVDSAALPRVPLWRPEFGTDSAAETARVLHPSAAAPFLLRSGHATLTVRSEPQPVGAQLRLTLVLRALSGGPPIRAGLGLLIGGQRDYPVTVPQCARGCRVAGLQAEYARSEAAPTELSVIELRDAASGRVVIGADDFARRWRVDGDSATGGPGLRVTVTGLGPRRVAWAVPDDVPDPSPAIVAGQLPATGELPGLDSDERAVTRAGAASALPRVGGRGALMDLEYAERRSTGSTMLPVAEVWLAGDAPVGLSDRLREQGLTLIRDGTPAQERARAGRRAPALAIWFHLVAAGFATALALGGMVFGAAVDRRRQRDDERALRRQGLSARAADRAALWAQLPIVLAALATGALAAAVAWWLSGEYLPIFVDRAVELTPPRWPAILAVAWPWALATVAFVAAAAGLRWALRVRD